YPCDIVPGMSISRRDFLTTAAVSTLGMASAQSRRIPIGLELFSVRAALQADLMGTLRSVAKQGYEVVEFFAPYFMWTPAQAKDVRKLMDDLGLKCHSTHNGSGNFKADNLQKAIEL